MFEQTFPMAIYKSKKDAEEASSSYYLDFKGNTYRIRMPENNLKKLKRYKFYKLIEEEIRTNEWVIQVSLEVLNGLPNETHIIEVDSFLRNFRKE